MYRAFLFLLFPDVAFVTIIILTNYHGSPKFLSFIDLIYRLFGGTDGLENNRYWNYVRSIDRIPSFVFILSSFFLAYKISLHLISCARFRL